MDEKIDALDKNGEPTGEVVWKSEAHRQGIWHRCFHCWVLGVDSSGPYLLVQRRAATKGTWPEKLDVSAAGHLGEGETPLDGRRELEEELGLAVDPGSLVPLGTRKIQQEIPEGCDREFHEVFLLQDSTPPKNLHLQREEVESVLGLNLDEIEALGRGEWATVVEWRDGKPFVNRISMADFVPNDDGYLFRVADAARRLYAGEVVDHLYE